MISQSDLVFLGAEGEGCEPEPEPNLTHVPLDRPGSSGAVVWKRIDRHPKLPTVV